MEKKQENAPDAIITLFDAKETIAAYIASGAHTETPGWPSVFSAPGVSPAANVGLPVFDMPSVHVSDGVRVVTVGVFEAAQAIRRGDRLTDTFLHKNDTLPGPIAAAAEKALMKLFEKMLEMYEGMPDADPVTLRELRTTLAGLCPEKPAPQE